MAEVTLLPGDVFRSEFEDEQGGFPPLVGSPPQWADDDDGTYVVISNDTTLGVHGALAYLEPFVFPGLPTTAVFHVRASTTSANPSPIASLLLPDGGAPLVLPLWAQATPTTTWYVSDPIEIPDPSAFAASSGSGTIRLGASQDASGFPDTRTTIYEAHVVVTYGDAPMPTTTPVTRLFPRDDALGNGSAPRLVPAPRAGRIVGGYN